MIAKAEKRLNRVEQAAQDAKKLLRIYVCETEKQQKELHESFDRLSKKHNEILERIATATSAEELFIIRQEIRQGGLYKGEV